MVMRYLGGVNSPSYNPLAANVTTGTTVIQDGGVYTVASAAQANGLVQWIDDPYFGSDTTLLQADNFADGSQNNTFIDSSQNNLAITRTGNATQGSRNPFSAPTGYWSNSFDGTGDYIQVVGNTNLAFGSGDFTFELFVYFTSLSSFQTLYDGRPNATSTGAYPALYFDSTAARINYFANTATQIASNAAPVINQWTHVAISRVSGTTRMFINGIVQTQTYTDGTTYLNGTNRPILGATGDSQNNFLFGFLSNVRAIKGTGLYTTSFTPPTSPLTAVTNTQLLTLQDNRLIDNSTNAFAVTKAGDTAAGLFTPFNSPVPGQYPAIQWGASMSFNGSTQYLTVAGSSNLAFGTADFTIELFIYFSSVAVQQIIYDARPSGTSSGAYPVIYFDGTAFKFIYYVSGAARITADNVPAANRWHHLVVSRVSGTTRMFVNGAVQTQTWADTTTYLNGTSRPAIACAGDSIGAGPFNGLLSNIRVLNGTGFTSVTVPTSSLPAITNTQLLTCQGSAVDSSANNYTITNTGTATVSTSGPFTIQGSNGSMYFDGTGDYLNLAGPSQLAFGSSDFSIEFWIYLTSLPVSPAGFFFYDSRPSGDGAYPCIFLAPTTNVLTYYVNTGYRITGTTAVSTNQWYYVSLSRVSGNTRMFLNGVQEGSTYVDATVYLNGASRPVIANNGLNLGGPVMGYMSNLRVNKGTGFTTSPVPTAPVLATTSTQLLLNGTNAGIVDTAARTVNETVGNAQVSTSIKKYGSGSMYFDGTGDWLLVPNSNDLNLGTGDFTIEAWVNLANTTAARSLVAKGTGTTGWEIYFNASPALFIFAYGSSIAYSSTVALNQNQWYHVAAVRSGTGNNNFRMYINGLMTLEFTITNDLTTTSSMYVGASRTGTTPMFGYIDDLRISKFARYTGPFIPPAVAMQKQG